MIARAVFFLLFATTASAAPAQLFHYGALAVDRRDGYYYGWATDHPTLADAGDRALDECRKRGGKCHVVLAWSGRGCGAYRTVENNVGTAYGWGVAETREDADAIATREASKRAKGAPAPRFVWGCNAGEAAEFRPLFDAGGDVEARTLTGHTGDVTTVDVSPDGRTIASGADDKTIRLWDAATGEAKGTLVGHGRRVNDLRFSPDGSRIASAGVDTLRIWDVAAQRELHEMPEFPNSSVGVAFSPDGGTVAAGYASWPTYGTKDGSVRLWSASSGSLLETHPEVMYVGVSALAWSRSGLLVAAGDDGDDDDIQALVDGSWRGVSGDDGLGHAVAFSPDETLLAAGSQDDFARIFDARNFRLLRKLYVGQYTATRGVAFSPDGLELATGDTHGFVKIWNPATGELLETLTHEKGKPVDGLAYSPDGRFLVSGGQDRLVKIWPRFGGGDEKWRALASTEQQHQKTVAKAKALTGASEARKRRRAP